MKPGFEYQRDTYSCGAYAFGHAALLLGKPLTIKECKKLCNTISYWKAITDELERIEIVSDIFTSIMRMWEAVGTDEKGIISGVKKIGLKPTVLLTKSKDQAIEFLKKKSPVILHINAYSASGHWVTTAGYASEKFIIIDSSPKNKDIVDFYSERELLRKLVWDDGFSCFGIAVESKNTFSCLKNFPDVVKLLKKDDELKLKWGDYLSDLFEIFDTKSGSAAGFIARYENKIIEEIDYRTEEDAQHLVQCYKTIAYAYNLGCSNTTNDDLLIEFVTLLLSTLILEEIR